MNVDYKMEKAHAIVEKYKDMDDIFPGEFQLDDVGLYPRLLRAVHNQATGGEATFSRYAIFMNDIIGYIDKSNEFTQTDKKEDSITIMKKVRNALSAFSEIQMEVFDTIFKKI